MSREVFEKAKRAYDSATRSYWAQRDSGGIVPLDMDTAEDAEESYKGVKFKCVTPAAQIVLGAWQKCKAELDAAAADIQRQAGDMECPVCPRKKGDGLLPPPEQDSRLPPERDDFPSEAAP